MIFRNYPGGEVALDRVNQSGIGRTLVVVHGNNNVIAVFLYARQVANLFQTAFPGLTGSHTAVQRNCTGVSNCTAAGRGVEDLGGGNSTAAQEVCLFPLRIVFLIQHFYKTLDLCIISSVILIQSTNVLKDVSHFVDCVITTLRSRTVTGNALYINTDFHTSALSSVDTAVCRLGGNNKFRTNLVFVDDVLPAKTVTVLLLNSSNN